MPSLLAVSARLTPEHVTNLESFASHHSLPQRPNIPFLVPTPEAAYIHVSSDQHMKELKDATKEQMSLHALSKEVSRDYLGACAVLTSR